MKQHTPHPWKIVPCSNPHEAFAIESNGKTICWVANTYDEKRDREVITAEDRANARLIATAPEMLDVLEWAVETADSEQYEASWYASARVAIAKAKGEIK
jgi:hypothetical protein